MKRLSMFIGLVAILGSLQDNALAQSGQVTSFPPLACQPNEDGVQVTFSGTWTTGGKTVRGFAMPYYYGTEPPIAMTPDYDPSTTGGTVSGTVPKTQEYDGQTYDLGGVFVWFEFGHCNEDGSWVCEACTGWWHQAWYGGGCFAKGTPVLTPMGNKPIEQIEEGDIVLSVDNEHLNAKPVTCRVTELIQRHDRLVDIKVAGYLIKATLDHCFYVKNKGWTPARGLVAGDLLRTHDQRWVKVQSVTTTDRHAHVVYNLCLDKHSTYFVGNHHDSTFSVLVHSDCKRSKADAKSATSARRLSHPTKGVESHERHKLFSFVPYHASV